MFDSTALGECISLTAWKDTNKFHTSITDGAPVKGHFDTCLVSKASKPASLGRGHCRDSAIYPGGRYCRHRTELGDNWLRKCVEVLIESLLELLASDINNNGDIVHKIDM